MTNLVRFLETAQRERDLTQNHCLIRDLIAEVTRASGKSRAVITDEMGKLLGTEVTLHMLNAYTATSKQQQVRFPASFVPAFCVVTGDDRLQRALLSPWLRKVLEIGEHELAVRKGVDCLMRGRG